MCPRADVLKKTNSDLFKKCATISRKKKKKSLTGQRGSLRSKNMQRPNHYVDAKDFERVSYFKTERLLSWLF